MSAVSVPPFMHKPTTRPNGYGQPVTSMFSDPSNSSFYSAMDPPSQARSYLQQTQQQSTVPQRSNNRKKEARECIHSGHFMVSEIDESASEVTVDPDEIYPRGYDDSDKPVLGPIEENEVDLDAKEEKKEYRYGPTDNQKTVTIDDSLNKLFQCMSLAYEGQLTSPKWKDFKGLRLKVKDKIRLNNIIWREWYMQYVSGRRPPVCHFQTTIDVHNKPEAVLLEGKYWKRGTSTVTAEYKKWRLFSIKEKNATLSNYQSVS